VEPGRNAGDAEHHAESERPGAAKRPEHEERARLPADRGGDAQQGLREEVQHPDLDQVEVPQVHVQHHHATRNGYTQGSAGGGLPRPLPYAKRLKSQRQYQRQPQRVRQLNGQFEDSWRR